jgi:carbon starvation protein CstA
MSRAHLLIFSIIGGAFITITLTWTAFSIDNKKLSHVLLWQDTIFLYLVGPGPPLGHDAQGNQMHEGDSDS